MGQMEAEQSAAVIEQDLSCMTCQYNLRTLPRAGRCPECGTEVERSYAATLPENYGWKDLEAGAAVLAWTPLLNAMLLPFVTLGMPAMPGLEWIRAALLLVPQLLIDAARSWAIYQIARSRPGPLNRSQRLCVRLGVVLVLLWTLVILMSLSGPFGGIDVGICLVPTLLIEGTLTLAAHRFLHHGMRPVQAYHVAVIRPVMFIASGFLLMVAAGLLIVLMSMTREPYMLVLAVTGMFLFSRVAHVAYWLLVSEVAQRQIRQL